jgi:hypothetical protein
MRYGNVGLWSGAALGAGVMFLLDPDRGGRRRALVRDKAVRMTNKAGDTLSATARDMSNRATGVACRTRSLWRSEEADDDVIVSRVRASLGRVASHPGSIEVISQFGRVTLSGPILAHEVAGVLARVAGVRGVASVDNQLDVHESPDNVPGLQGGSVPGACRVWSNWSPTARILAGTAAAALATYAVTRMIGDNGAVYGEM